MTDAEPTQAEFEPDDNEDDVDEDAGVDSEFKLLSNGRVRIRFAGSSHLYILRAPNFGEFRKLREGLRTKPDPEDDPDGLFNAAWFRTVVDMLTVTRPLTHDDDEMPAWVVNGSVAVKLVNHWLAVPSAPGSK